MKLFLRVVQVWLALCFVLSFFAVPLYLIAIYPRVPDAYYRFSRLFGYGVVQAPASELGFWYRLVGCGAVVLLGLLLTRRWLLDLAADRRTSQSPQPNSSTNARSPRRGA
jgi:hypothetical protein